MRRLAFVPLILVAAACSESPRVRVKMSLEGQSPPEPPPPAAPSILKETPPPNSAVLDSPVWLRANAPVQWTCPAGWEEIQSTRPQRLVEFTMEKNGPGGAPIQLVILNGADDHPAARQASITRWETFFHQDRATETTQTEHDDLKVVRMKCHGTFEGPPLIGSSDMINEPNWAMIYGWVEGPDGSVLFKALGPDTILDAHEKRIDQLLASMKPRGKPK